MTMGRWLSTLRTLLLLPLVREVDARTWTDVILYHDLLPLDGKIDPPLEIAPLLFSESPTATPSELPSSVVTETPTPHPTASAPNSTPSPLTKHPTMEPTREPSTPSPTADQFPPNRPPRFPPITYFNYDTTRNALFGPGHPEYVHTSEGFVIQYQNNAWARTRVADDFYWSEFDDPGHGSWSGVLADRNPRLNQCGNVGFQSPIDVRMSGVACVEHHQIRTRPGDFRVDGARVEKRIEHNKLRLVYERRPCADILDTVCAEPDPPTADFPNGWGGFADVMHVDFKLPAEHRLNGEVFDGEMQIFHLHPGRRRVPAISSFIRVDPKGYNSYLQIAIDAFQHEYDLHRAQCADTMRRGRKLVSEFQKDIMGNTQDDVLTEGEEGQSKAAYDYYETWGDYSTLLDDPNFIAEGEEHQRRMQSTIWYPHHPSLIPTYWFYGYDGSLTEPPCSEFVSWFIMDTPMVISPDQLEQLQRILFTHVDPNCHRTSVHFNRSVARPIQESAGRQVWRCTQADFPPDSDRDD